MTNQPVVGSHYRCGQFAPTCSPSGGGGGPKHISRGARSKSSNEEGAGRVRVGWPLRLGLAAKVQFFSHRNQRKFPGSGDGEMFTLHKTGWHFRNIFMTAHYHVPSVVGERFGNLYPLA